MDPQQWLNELLTELQARRLPRRYVTRLMRELSDHVMDGWEKTMNTDVRVFAAPHDHPVSYTHLTLPTTERV